MNGAGWGLPVDADMALDAQDAARRFETAGAQVQSPPAFSTPEMALGIDLF